MLEDKFSLSAIEDLFAEIRTRTQFFVKVNLEAAYHQISLAIERQGLTIITTHMGTHKFL